ncbi:hypothetical protein [uncultured Brevundimonas sp.]|uniref:hypothetical protein n=1 Tax=uncultured Brevundimonas sp. TaxID=213418 RepID=UPI0025E0DFBA|nr:hypothetical protein [uncultured Brevundimonas sp.]
MPDVEAPTTFATLIRDYQARYGDDRARARRWWSSAPSPEEALARAFYDWEVPGGQPLRRLNSHQFRLGYGQVGCALQAARRHLPMLLDINDFDALMLAFSNIWRLEGVFLDAALLTYDVAERFGRYRGLYPEQVYLHAGAAQGARALGISGRRVPRHQFGPVLGKLEAAEIENFLCICKSDLYPDLRKH